MPQWSTLKKSDKVFYVTDGNDRGPLTIVRLHFHPSEPFLLAQTVDRQLALWDLNGKPEAIKKKKERSVLAKLICPHELGWIRGFDVSPDGKWIATGGSDRHLKVWQWSKDETVQDLQAHEGWVEAVAFSPDGKMLATAGADHLVKLWSFPELKPIVTLRGHTNYLRDLAWSSDGKMLISAGEDGLALVWDGQTHKRIRTIEFGESNEQQGQNPRLSGIHRIAVSHDNRWLAISGGERSALHHLSNGTEMATASREKQDVCFHGSAPLVALGESEVGVWHYDTEKFKPAVSEKKQKRSAGAIPGKKLSSIKRGGNSLGICFSPSGTQLAVGNASGVVELWNLS